MNLSPIIARIRDNVTPQLAVVGGAARFERAAQALTALPAAFVLPQAEQAQPNEFANGFVEQFVLVDFTVLIAVRNLTDDEGAAALDDLESVRASIRTALLGWTPVSGGYDCEFRSGEFLLFDNGVLWWQDVYRTGTLIRSA